VLLTGSKRLEIIETKTETTRKVIYELPAGATYSVTSLFFVLRLGDFYLFVSLTNHVAGKRFAIYADVKQAVSCSIKSLDPDLCYAGIRAFVS
jgi:hypothetical protein